MEKLLKITIVCLMIFSHTVFADTLVLSNKLKVEYATPKLISHSLTGLIVKYNDHKLFMHVVVDPKNIYQQIDLTGKVRPFLKSIFDEKERSKLSKELAVLSKEQADLFGVTSDNVHRSKAGDAEIIAVYNDKDNSGQIYIFEELSVHQMYTYGTKEEHDHFLHGIKER